MDTETISLHSPEVKAHLDQAYTYYEQEEFEQALLECEAALEIDPSLVHAHHLQGTVLEKLGRNIEAKAAYEQALELDPEFSEVKDDLLALEDKLALLPRWLRNGLIGILAFVAVTYALERYLWGENHFSNWDGLLKLVLITLYTPGFIVQVFLDNPGPGQELFNWTIRSISSLPFGYIGVAIAMKRKKVLRVIAILLLPLYLLFLGGWALLLWLASPYWGL